MRIIQLIQEPKFMHLGTDNDAIVSVSLINYSQGVYQVKASSATEEKTAKLIIIR